MKSKYLPHFMLLPSLSCQATCKYCFGPNTGPQMDKEIIKQAIDFMDSIVTETKQSKVNVTIHGGEPLMAGHKTIETILRLLNERFDNISIGMQSNLWLLDDEYCKMFKKYNVDIGTSLDGPKELNDAQRGEGYFNNNMAGINLAVSYGIGVGCIATFTAKTLPKWRDVFDFFMNKNIHFGVHPSVPVYDRDTMLDLTPEQYYKLFDEMFEYYLKNAKNIKLSSFDQMCASAANGSGGVCTFRNCFGMFLSINPLGEIYSCQRFNGNKEYCLGNVKDNPSMDELMFSDAAKKLLQREAVLKDECSDCAHYEYCKGGCAYIALSNPEDNRDIYCDAYKKIFDDIRQKLYEEMISDENQEAIAKFGPANKGNPLLREGQLTALTREDTHPYDITRTARRVVAAYELAKCKDTESTAQRLVDIDVSRSIETARNSLDAMVKRMNSCEHLNKLYIHATWTCQLKCSHCYASADEDNRIEMSVEDISNAIMDGNKLGFNGVVITGGEPLMHRDRDEILIRLAECRKHMNETRLILRTNFTMPLNIDDMVKIFAAFDEIVVSIDGGKEEHDARRGKGTYNKLVENLEFFAENRAVIQKSMRGVSMAKLALSAVLSANEIENEPGKAVKELANRLEIKNVKFRPMLPLGRATDAENIPMPEGMLQSPMDVLSNGFRPRTTCGIGQNMYVEPTGEAFPCYAYHKPSSFLGNIITDGLETIINSDKFAQLKCHTVDTNIKCKECDYRYICGGVCKAWCGEGGGENLDSAPLDCETAKKRAKELYIEACKYLRIT